MLNDDMLTEHELKTLTLPSWLWKAPIVEGYESSVSRRLFDENCVNHLRRCDATEIETNHDILMCGNDTKHKTICVNGADSFEDAITMAAMRADELFEQPGMLEMEKR